MKSVTVTFSIVRFPKPKDEGWFLVLGSVEDRELIALKRVPMSRNLSTTQQLTFFTPEVAGRVVYTLYVMSDAYLGLDQQYEVCLEAAEDHVEVRLLYPFFLRVLVISCDLRGRFILRRVF